VNALSFECIENICLRKAAKVYHYSPFGTLCHPFGILLIYLRVLQLFTRLRFGYLSLRLPPSLIDNANHCKFFTGKNPAFTGTQDATTDFPLHRLSAAVRFVQIIYKWKISLTTAEPEGYGLAFSCWE
jgi:hypothetical protein